MPDFERYPAPEAPAMLRNSSAYTNSMKNLHLYLLYMVARETVMLKLRSMDAV